MRISKVEHYFLTKNWFVMDTIHKTVKIAKAYLSNAEKRKITFLKRQGYSVAKGGN